MFDFFQANLNPNQAKFSDFESLTSYLRFTSLSVKDTSIEKIEEVSKEEAIIFQKVNG